MNCHGCTTGKMVKVFDGDARDLDKTSGYVCPECMAYAAEHSGEVIRSPFDLINCRAHYAIHGALQIRSFLGEQGMLHFRVIRDRERPASQPPRSIERELETLADVDPTHVLKDLAARVSALEQLHQNGHAKGPLNMVQLAAPQRRQWSAHPEGSVCLVCNNALEDGVVSVEVVEGAFRSWRHAEGSPTCTKKVSS